MGSKYSKEFRQDALRICEREGVKEASEKLGVPLKALYTWRREERLERVETLKGLFPGKVRSMDSNGWNERTTNYAKPTIYLKKRWVLWWVGNSAKTP